MQFSGTITQKIDGKGRVSIPADYRRVLELGDPDFTPEGKRFRMRVVYGDPERRCLEVYPLNRFQELMAQIKTMPPGDEGREILELLFVSGSDSVEVDGDGRTILSQKLRDHLGIPRDGGEAVFAGALDTFRIWSPEEFEGERRRKLAAARARIPGGGNPLKLLPQTPEG